MGQPVQQQSWSQRCRGLPPAPPRRLIRATSSQLLSFPQFLRKKPKTTAVWSLLQRKGGYLEVQCMMSSKKNISAIGDYNGYVGLGVKCSKEVAITIRGAIILAKFSIVPLTPT